MQTGPLPIVIGIVGHRNLRAEDIPSLEQKVREFLQEMKDKYPSTALVLLSALAEGADRLAARVALDLGYRLVAPLPFPKEEYLKDFETAKSREEFENLLHRTDRWFALDPPSVQGSAQEPSGPAPLRNIHYATA